MRPSFGTVIPTNRANLEDAKKRLEEEYGEGHVFNLHGEKDAVQPR
jgi:hypothetical protein